MQLSARAPLSTVKFLPLSYNKYGVWYLVDGYLFKSPLAKTKTRREAQARLRQHNDGKYGLEPVSTVQKFYDEWIEKKVPPLVRHSRVRDYKQAFAAYILPRFKHGSLADIKTKDLIDFQAELLKKRLGVECGHTIIDGSFRALYRDARVEIGGELEGKDPFIDVRLPKVKHEPPDPLTAKEREQVLDAFLEHEPFYYPFMRVQFDTGMRPSETVGLTWADTNTEMRTIRIHHSRYMNQDNDHPKTTHSGRMITVAGRLWI
jgi:integrase